MSRQPQGDVHPSSGSGNDSSSVNDSQSAGQRRPIPSPRPGSSSSSPAGRAQVRVTDVDQQLALLQREMDILRRERMLLEADQERVLARQQQQTAGDSSRRSASANNNRSSVSGGSELRRSASGSRPQIATDVPPAEPPILPERKRVELRQAKGDVFVEMKQAMRRSWEHDSTLVGGFFLQKDNPKVGTFGRSSKFQPIVGRPGQYFLAQDVQKMQSNVIKGDTRHLSVSTRGRVGTNVNSHWNDSKGGTAPGPGSYTPRYAILSSSSTVMSSERR